MYLFQFKLCCFQNQHWWSYYHTGSLEKVLNSIHCLTETSEKLQVPHFEHGRTEPLLEEHKQKKLPRKP